MDLAEKLKKQKEEALEKAEKAKKLREEKEKEKEKGLSPSKFAKKLVQKAGAKIKVCTKLLHRSKSFLENDDMTIDLRSAHPKHPSTHLPNHPRWSRYHWEREQYPMESGVPGLKIYYYFSSGNPRLHSPITSTPPAHLCPVSYTHLTLPTILLV